MIPEQYHQEIRTRLGGYNDFPPGWTEITAHDYAVKLQNNSVIAVDHQQMFSDKSYDRHSTNWTLLIFRDFSGVASTADYQRVNNETFGGYDYITKFWMFGCDHSFKEVPWDAKFGTQFRGLHLWKCSKCGECQVVDSSD